MAYILSSVYGTFAEQLLLLDAIAGASVIPGTVYVQIAESIVYIVVQSYCTFVLLDIEVRIMYCRRILRFEESLRATYLW